MFISLFYYLGLISCNGQVKKLNPNEIELIQIINLDRENAEKIKNLSTGNFEESKGSEDRNMLFENIDELKNYEIPKAIKITAESQNSDEIIKSFKNILKEKKLILYRSGTTEGGQKTIITILKSENKFEPLYFEATNGVNYDIQTPKIVERLKLWDSLYGIELNGVGFDFVDAQIQNLPKDINKFSKEMYEFCPDIVDQGVGSVDALTKSIKDSRHFFLWWD